MATTLNVRPINPTNTNPSTPTPNKPVTPDEMEQAKNAYNQIAKNVHEGQYQTEEQDKANKKAQKVEQAKTEARQAIKDHRALENMDPVAIIIRMFTQGYNLCKLMSNQRLSNMFKNKMIKAGLETIRAIFDPTQSLIYNQVKKYVTGPNRFNNFADTVSDDKTTTLGVDKDGNLESYYNVNGVKAEDKAAQQDFAKLFGTFLQTKGYQTNTLPDGRTQVLDAQNRPISPEAFNQALGKDRANFRSFLSNIEKTVNEYNNKIPPATPPVGPGARGP